MGRSGRADCIRFISETTGHDNVGYSVIHRPLFLVLLLLVGGVFLVALSVRTSGETVDAFEQRIVLSSAEEQALPDPELTPAQQALEKELQSLGEAFDGTVGIAVTDTADFATMAYNGDAYLPQQSVSKLWVALAAMHAVDRGALDLAEPVAIGTSDLTVFHQPIRALTMAQGTYQTRYADLLERSITQSDNTANDQLLQRVGGPTVVQDLLDRWAIDNVRFGTDERTKQSAIAGLEWQQSYALGRNFYDARDAVPPARRKAAFEAYLADPMDGASAVGISRALARMARGDLLSAASTQYIRALLQQTRSGPRRLKGGVPPGWTIGHKTGTGQMFDGIQSGYNDVGILTAPDGTEYAVAVLIGQTRASYAARMSLMQDVVRRIVRHHEQRAVTDEGSSPESDEEPTS